MNVRFLPWCLPLLGALLLGCSAPPDRVSVPSRIAAAERTPTATTALPTEMPTAIYTPPPSLTPLPTGNCPFNAPPARRLVVTPTEPRTGETVRLRADALLPHTTYTGTVGNLMNTAELGSFTTDASGNLDATFVMPRLNTPGPVSYTHLTLPTKA